MREITRNVMHAMLAMQRHPWEQGVCGQALFEAGEENLWVSAALDSVKRQDRLGRLCMLGGRVDSADPASAGEICLRASECFGLKECGDGAARMLQYLKETAPRTADGVICHRNMKTEDGRVDQQVWIDGLYMVPPFLAAMHEMDDAWCQVTGFVRYLLDPETHVFFHIWDAGSGTFVRRKRWATGTGWALMGIARVAVCKRLRDRRSQSADHAVLFRGHDALHIGSERADRLFDSVLDGMLRYRTEDDTFHDVLDEPDTFKDHTAGLMMAAAVYRRIAEGKLDDTCLQAADAIVASAEKDIDRFGMIHNVCGAPDFAHQGTSAEAQAAFVMADAWKQKISRKEE